MILRPGTKCRAFGVRAMAGVGIEQLDPRVLLAAQVVASTLTVTGTGANDSIVVAAHKRFINILVVVVNDELH